MEMINVRVDSNDKKNFELFCNNVGMNISTAINMYIKNVLMEQKLPFEIKSGLNDEIIYKKLLESDKQISSTNKRYSTDEIINHIDKIIG